MFLVHITFGILLKVKAQEILNFGIFSCNNTLWMLPVAAISSIYFLIGTTELIKEHLVVVSQQIPEEKTVSLAWSLARGPGELILCRWPHREGKISRGGREGRHTRS